MRCKSRWVRIPAVVGMSALAFVFLLFAVVQVQQRLLRYRCERLLKDFQAIRLHESTWDDAQRMMTRWGAWGHYDGTCTAADCEYTITLTDAVESIERRKRPNFAFALLYRVMPFYTFLGGRPGRMQVSFLVQDGTIWRSGVFLRIYVPPHARRDEEYGYSLMVSARASQSLHRTEKGPWVLGNDAQLALHPNYKAGRPGGCTFCMLVEVTFTPAISAAELMMISDYDLSCLTRFHPCLQPADLLPVEREWRLYTEEPKAQADEALRAPVECPVPLAARARDGEEVLVVDVLSSPRKEPKAGAAWPNDEARERASVRVVQVLKSEVGYHTGDLLEVIPGSVEPVMYPAAATRGLDAGKRIVLIIFRGRDLRRTGVNNCSALPDSPEILKEIGDGLAQNDVLRRKQGFQDSVWE